MPIAIPRSVRDVWGEDAAEDFARWFEQAVREVAVPRDEYREVLSRLDVVETRLEALEDDVAEVKSALGEQRREMLDLRREMNERFDQMNAQFNGRFDQMHEAMRVQTRWTIGAIIIIGAIMTTLLAIAEFAA